MSRQQRPAGIASGWCRLELNDTPLNDTPLLVWLLPGRYDRSGDWLAVPGLNALAHAADSTPFDIPPWCSASLHRSSRS